MGIVFEGLPEAVERIREGTLLVVRDFEWMEKIPEQMERLTIEVSFKDAKELSVRKNGAHLKICCGQSSHYFRGLAGALANLEKSVYEKTESVFFPHIGLMLDCSRNAVFTVEKVKSIIRILAGLGYDELLLYMEDTYEIPDEPYFGAYRGRYTQQELREIESYAGIFGMEVIPCIQTLAHLHNVLKWPPYDSVRDSRDVLQVGKEETYRLIEKILTSVRDTFSSRRVHLGMDEAVELGLGNYLRENGYKKSADLMREHCDRVLAICEKLGLKPVMWSDMYLTSNSGRGYYETPLDADTSGWEKPAPGLGLVYWDYYHSDEAFYDGMLKLHRKLSDEVIFAGGCWIWNGIAPNYSRTFACTEAALVACRKNKISEVFCTAWMDNGAETPVDAVLPGAAMFAHMGFHEKMNEKELAEEFEAATGGSWQAFLTLDRFDRLFLDERNPENFDLQKRPNLESENPSKYLLYQDSLLGIFDFHLQGEGISEYYGALAKDLAEVVPGRKMSSQWDLTEAAFSGKMSPQQDLAETSPAGETSPYQEFFAYYQCLAEVLASKGSLGVRMKRAYDTDDSVALAKISGEEIPALIQKLETLRNLRQELWMRDAKPFGYELLDLRLGGVALRLESCKKRLDGYLNGRWSKLEELEGDRLPYFPEGSPAIENRWQQIISGSDFTDTI